MRLIKRAATQVSTIDWCSRDNLLRLAIIVSVSVAVITSILLRRYITISQAGYVGVALSSLVAGGGLVIPVPALATACTIGALLNPSIVALVASTAEAIGELSGYFLGYSGQGIFGQRPFYIRMERLMSKTGWLALLLVSMIPNPVFDFVGVAAGALRYPLWRFLAFVWTGKIIKFGGIAYACTYGAGWLLDYF